MSTQLQWIHHVSRDGHAYQVRQGIGLYPLHDPRTVQINGFCTNPELLGGTKRFELGASGHIAGVINPPAREKRHYWTNNRVTKNPETWFKNAQQHTGSWWNDWFIWLAEHAGERQPSMLHTGNAQYPALESAPGRYVMQ